MADGEVIILGPVQIAQLVTADSYPSYSLGPVITFICVSFSGG